RRDRFAQLPEHGDRRVVLILRDDVDRGDPRGGAGERARLGLALAEIAPLRIVGIEAARLRLGGDVDDAGAGDRAEGRLRWSGHRAAETSTPLRAPGATRAGLARGRVAE